MNVEENPVEHLPRAGWTEDEVVEHDILTDLLREAVGVLTSRIHAERSSADPRAEVVDRLAAQRSGLTRSLRALRIADAGAAEELRHECLELIRDQGSGRADHGPGPSESSSSDSAALSESRSPGGPAQE